ncbi:MAG: 23S rRNA (pseudouridine(1915)-N(3))-methyltransferase RlmH [Patescibacteria group bacterium]
MHHFLLRVIGSSQSDWQRDAITEYLTKLKPFTKVDVVELPEGHRGSAKPDLVRTRKDETERLFHNLSKDVFIVALEEQGKNLDSVTFANTIANWSDQGRTVAFFIAGSWGFDPALVKHAHATISLGKQTLPHLLARIVLLEQLYRTETILAGKTYHK